MPDQNVRLMPAQLREARLLPTTFDAEARTIEVTWGQGVRVRRYDWFRERYYDEELQMDEKSCDLSRLASGNAAVLDGHNRWSLSAQIGVVQSATIKRGEGHAVIRLSDRAEVAGIVGDIRAGIIKNISVGYSVQRFEIDQAAGDEVPVYRAVAWQPNELSFVSIPADATATTRNAPESAQGGSPCEFTTRAQAPTPEPTMPQPASAAAAATRAAAEADTQNPTPAAASAAADPAANAAQESQRSADIVDLCTRHGFADRAAEYLRAGHSVEKVRGLILDELATRDASAGGHINRIQAGDDEADKFRGAASDALLARALIVNPATKSRYVIDGANPTRGLALRELARMCLNRIGVRTDGMSPLEMVGRAFTQSGSDFPILLEAAMHKSLQAGYALAADTWQSWCAKGTVSDFRAHNRYRVGSLGNLDALTELGEFKNKTIPDGEKASIQAGTKGNIINLSRQAIINDDLGAFIGAASMLGRAAARTVEADAYALLASNPTMSDGIELFHADHGNLDAAGAPTVATIGAASDKMAAQTDVSGHDILDLKPAVFLGNKTYARQADVAVNSTYDPDANSKLQRKNAVYNEVGLIVGTARITDSKWYLFADPSEAPVIEVAFLEGEDQPFLDQQDGFTVDGSRWKVRMDYGVGAIDYRGAVRNG